MKQWGMDISKHQGSVDFSKVKADRIEFAILRSSYRKTTDQRFLEYVKGCKENSIPIFGVYHFIYALNDEQALEEAKYCVSQVEKAGLDKSIYIFSDFEGDSVKQAAKVGVTLGKKECNSFTKIFCDYVKSKGYKTGIYTNINYYKNWYTKELLSEYPIWLADYDGEPNYKCLLQQYTSSGRVNGINTKVDLNRFYGEEETDMSKSRQSVVNLVTSWIGKNEKDGSHKSIIDIYNSYSGTFPRGIKMQYNWSWCACTWSALAIKLGYTDIMPIEISCGYLIEAAKKMGVWKENDDFIPKPGDAILYDWDDKGIGNDTGWPEHVGTVVEVHEKEGYFVVVEGNYNDQVKKRTMSINGKYIRGFITPKYDDNTVVEPPKVSGKSIDAIAREVIAGVWGSGDKRKQALVSAGYDYSAVQKRVNEILNGSAVKSEKPVQDQTKIFIKTVSTNCTAKKFDKSVAGTYKTTADLYCRNDAGKNKKAICLIPKNTEVKCYGYYNVSNGVKWYLIQFIMDKVQYTGFSSSAYLKK